MGLEDSGSLVKRAECCLVEELLAELVQVEGLHRYTKILACKTNNTNLSVDGFFKGLRKRKKREKVRRKYNTGLWAFSYHSHTQTHTHTHSTDKTVLDLGLFIYLFIFILFFFLLFRAMEVPRLGVELEL